MEDDNMMVEKTVSKVEQITTKTGKPMYLVEFTDGVKASTFETYRGQILQKYTGRAVELEITVNGEYTNIGAIKDEGMLAEEVGGVVVPPKAKSGGGFGGGKADPAKIVSIERQATAKMVLAYYGAVNKEISLESFKKTADFVADWIANVDK